MVFFVGEHRIFNEAFVAIAPFEICMSMHQVSLQLNEETF
jgi:hypothetical protein